MATSAFILMSILTTNNAMSNMFDLKAQEKNKLQQFRKQQCENNRFHMSKYRGSMYNNKTHKTYNTNSKHYNYLNYNIAKEYKR
jgi:hypothetical protein